MITQRLKCIIDHTNGARIADIGTDHAYIPIHIIQNDMAEYVIAGDVRQGPVDIARTNVKKNNLSDKIEVRLGSGLSILKNREVDTIIIAGMGGQLIREIIDADIEIAKECKLVLQPMNAQYELRKYLIYNNFKINDEDLAVEGFKVYNVMNVQSGVQDKFENDFEYQIPKYLLNHKYFRNLYDKKHREFTKVIRGLENSKEVDKEKLDLYKYWLGELEKYESK
ncbi:MAG: tRNA (adenine(22)-N(1))-methyltransferase [Hominilimicola sp.]